MRKVYNSMHTNKLRFVLSKKTCQPCSPLNINVLYFSHTVISYFNPSPPTPSQTSKPHFHNDVGVILAFCLFLDKVNYEPYVTIASLGITLHCGSVHTSFPHLPHLSPSVVSCCSSSRARVHCYYQLDRDPWNRDLNGQLHYCVDLFDRRNRVCECTKRWGIRWGERSKPWEWWSCSPWAVWSLLLCRKSNPLLM